MRYALFFTPARNHPLTRGAASWLGRDAFTGKAVKPPIDAQIPASEYERLTAMPRRYGFHATIKAPFRLAGDATEQDLLAALDAFSSSIAPFLAPPLQIAVMDGFFALTPISPSGAIQEFAGGVVTAFDHFRAPLTEAEIASRNPELLTARQLGHLHRWGYPFVLDEFRFHMTLGGPIRPGDESAVGPILHGLFGPLLREPPVVDAITLFVEPAPGAPFCVRSRHELGSSAIDFSPRKEESRQGSANVR